MALAAQILNLQPKPAPAPQPGFFQVSGGAVDPIDDDYLFESPEDISAVITTAPVFAVLTTAPISGKPSTAGASAKITSAVVSAKVEDE